jgi:tetratricopeptide (TPR) repeat protein
MLEQADTGEDRGVAIVSLKLALSQEARQSLAAVRVAQESAQRRARRQTMQARIGVVLLAGAVAAAAISWGPRLAHWRQSRAQAAKAARTPVRTPARMSSLASSPSATPISRPTSPVAPEPKVVAAATVPVAHPAIAAQPVIAKPAAGVKATRPSVPVAAAVVAPEKANDSGVPAEGCDTSSRRGLWRRSPEACARAFAADPKNASLALAVAQAEHAHARFDEAAQWAKRALALDPNAAEAYIIIARADTENGRDDDARAAYQRYLEVAPRGWHKAEARAALRRASLSSR